MQTEHRRIDADAVVVAVPHDVVAADPARRLPSPTRPLAGLGTSAVVDVHLVFDRQVTDLAMAAGVDSPVQYVFDRTDSAGVRPRPVPGRVALGRRRPARPPPDDLIAEMTAALAALLPGARHARVVDSLVTKERAATFRAVPGTGRCGPGAATGVRRAGRRRSVDRHRMAGDDGRRGAQRPGRGPSRAAGDGPNPKLPEEVA